MGSHWRHLTNTTEPSMCGGDVAFLAHILVFYYMFWTNISAKIDPSVSS